jgi:hypothetical protein
MVAITNTRLIDITAYTLVIFIALFILLFGWKFHPIEKNYSAERDGYVAHADTLRNGKFPHDDAHRPLLYPILSAGAGSLLNDTFSGARLISQISAIFLALLTYLLGRACFNAQVGLIALILLISNYHFITYGVMASTDILFCTLSTSVLLSAIHANYSPQYKSFIILALTFSLSYFTRYTALALLPSIAFSLANIPQTSKIARMRWMAIFFLATVLFLLPHFTINTHIFGSPFYNENWKNLAFKLYGEKWGFSYLNREIPFDGLLDVILYSPVIFLTGIVTEFRDFVTSHFPKLLGNRQVIGIFFALLTSAGIILSLFSLDRKKSILLLFFVSFITMVSIFYITTQRIMMPVLPISYIFISYSIVSIISWERFKLSKLNVFSAKRHSLIIVIVLLLAVQLPFLFISLQRFAKEHPIKEVEAAIELQKKYGSNLRVLGTFFHTQRYVDYCFFYLYEPSKEEQKNKQLYYERVKKNIQDVGAQYLIVGKLTLKDKPADLLSNNDMPPFLSLLYKNDDVTVYRIIWNYLAVKEPLKYIK